MFQCLSSGIYNHGYWYLRHFLLYNNISTYNIYSIYIFRLASACVVGDYLISGWPFSSNFWWVWFFLSTLYTDVNVGVEGWFTDGHFSRPCVWRFHFVLCNAWYCGLSTAQISIYWDFTEPESQYCDSWGFLMAIRFGPMLCVWVY